jgi:hypothetical protein
MNYQHLIYHHFLIYKHWVLVIIVYDQQLELNNHDWKYLILIVCSELKIFILKTIDDLDNQIDTCTGLEQSKIPNLLTLEMRENRLITTKGLSLPNLKNLFLVNIFNSIDHIASFPVFV